VLTPEARMALAAWCGVTLVLLVVYALVLLLV
jgi:hypothetical protein